MKKIAIIASFIFFLFLGGCTNQNKQGGDVKKEKIVDYNVELINCTISTEKCEDGWKQIKSMKKMQIDYFETKNLVDIWDFSEEQIRNIISNDPNLYGKEIVVNTSKKTIKSIQHGAQACKTYDVWIDFSTYKNMKTIEEKKEYLQRNRINRLKDFLIGNNSSGLSINNGDKIIVRFIGTNKQNAVNDKFELHIGEPCEQTFKVEDSAILVNNSLKKIQIYYTISKEEEINYHETESYNNLDDVINKVSNRLSSYVDSNKTYGFFLLEHFLENTIPQYKENYTTIILSDFLFQLSQSDKNILVQRFCNVSGYYCNPETYVFSVENVSKRYKDSWFFKTLFTKHIFDTLPSLQDLCPTESGNKLDVFLLGIDTNPGISTQDKIKDFYSNYLLKNCNVYYK